MTMETEVAKLLVQRVNAGVLRIHGQEWWAEDKDDAHLDLEDDDGTVLTFKITCELVASDRPLYSRKDNK